MSTIKKKNKKNQRRSPLKTVAVDNIGLARKPRSWSYKFKKMYICTGLPLYLVYSKCVTNLASDVFIIGGL